MRKSILFLTLIFGSWSALAHAEKSAPAPEQVAMAYVPGNPLMQLPGMQPLAPASPAMSAPALPVPAITDVSNVPNPFDSRKGGRDGQTEVFYTLSKDMPVRITLYDLFGFRVRRWDFSAGQNGGRTGFNSFFWDGTNESGQKVSKGGYLAQIEIETPDTVVSVIRKIGVIH